MSAATPIEVADTVPPSAPRRARAKKARAALDDYPTPRPLVRAILPELPLGGMVVDPSCGAGVLLQEALAHALCRPVDIVLVGVDLNEARSRECRSNLHPLLGASGSVVVCRDALDPMPWPGDCRPSLVIMNPPFSHATQFAARALAEVAPCGTVAMLARLTFLESAERYREVFAKHGSPDVYVFSKRPQFRAGEKGTDSSTCAWFVWGPGRAGRLVVLPPSATTGER